MMVTRTNQVVIQFAETFTSLHSFDSTVRDSQSDGCKHKKRHFTSIANKNIFDPNAIEEKNFFLSKPRIDLQ